LHIRKAHTLRYDAGIMNSGELDINNLRQKEESTCSDNLRQRLTLRNLSVHGARGGETENTIITAKAKSVPQY